MRPCRNSAMHYEMKPLATFFRHDFGPESRSPHCLDHLLNRHFPGVIGDDGLFRLEAYLCVVDSIQPFQDQLHDVRSGASRHPCDTQSGALELFRACLHVHCFRLRRSITIPGIRVTTAHGKANHDQKNADEKCLLGTYVSHCPSSSSALRCSSAYVP